MKLLNIIYNKGEYSIYKPGNSDKKSHVSLIENYPWLIAQFMPFKRTELTEGDIVRFGRIPFAVSRIRLTADDGGRY